LNPTKSLENSPAICSLISFILSAISSFNITTSLLSNSSSSFYWTNAGAPSFAFSKKSSSNSSYSPSSSSIQAKTAFSKQDKIKELKIEYLLQSFGSLPCLRLSSFHTSHCTSTQSSQVVLLYISQQVYHLSQCTSYNQTHLP
jgi:hypothetical protein